MVIFLVLFFFFEMRGGIRVYLVLLGVKVLLVLIWYNKLREDWFLMIDFFGSLFMFLFIFIMIKILGGLVFSEFIIIVNWFWVVLYGCLFLIFVIFCFFIFFLLVKNWL